MYLMVKDLGNVFYYHFMDAQVINYILSMLGMK